MTAEPLDNHGNSFGGHDAPCVIWNLPQTEHRLHAGVYFSIKGGCLGHDTA